MLSVSRVRRARFPLGLGSPECDLEFGVENAPIALGPDCQMLFPALSSPMTGASGSTQAQGQAGPGQDLHLPLTCGTVLSPEP